MSSSDESTTNDTAEFPDYVHECLRYVPLYQKGVFSSGSSLDDGDDRDDGDDEDVKRILTKHGESETTDGGAAGFSRAHREAAAAVETQTRRESSAADKGNDDRPTDHYYGDWDEALRHVSAAYPALGARRNTKLRVVRPLDFAGTDGGGGGGGQGQELRKCLEGALYGQDSDDFVVAQPFCVANKNLDFGKPKMPRKAMRDSRNKVDNWMSKHCCAENDGSAATATHR